MTKPQAIVCRSHENSSVVDELIENTEAEIFLYDRGNPPLSDFNSPRVNHIKQENFRREAFVYINHIVNNYDNLSDKILFTQAKISDHRHEQVNSLSDFFNETPKNTNYHSFVTLSLDCNDFGSPHHTGLKIKHFWENLFETKCPKSLTFHPNGIFITSESAIKKHDLFFYKKILETFNSENGTQIDYILERLWGYILS
jgi:hypothetical protein